jgi:4-amino-4-deoxy-L-arabinose transferase-like glycosyltransferase
VLPWFAALGTTEFAARAAQVLHFVVGAGATAWAAHRASGYDLRAGGLAGAFFALSPLLAALSGLCMLETPGAAMTALTLACLASALDAEGRRAAFLDVATGAAVLATWFTKLNYGIWVLPAVAVGYVVPWRRSCDGRRVLLGLARSLGTVVLCLGAWYASPSQRAAFHGFLTNPAQAVSVVEDDPTFRLPGFRLDNFTGYFRLVAEEYHVHWTVGTLALVLFVVGTVRAVRQRNGAAAGAAACVVWTWLSLSMGFREYAMARFIAPALPAMWIVAAYGAAPLVARVAASTVALVVERVLLLAALVAQVLLFRAKLEAEYEVDARFRPVFAWLRETLPARASVMVVNYTDHVSARTLVWELGTRPGSGCRDIDVKGLIAERVYESDRLFGEWMDRPRAWGDSTWASIVVEMEPGPAYPDRAVVQDATVAMWARAVRERTEAHRLGLAASRRFLALDLRVRVWRDRSPPPQAPGGG